MCFWKRLRRVWGNERDSGVACFKVSVLVFTIWETIRRSLPVHKLSLLKLNTKICSWKHFTRGNSNAVTESRINIASLQLDPSSVRGISFSLFNIDPLCVAYKNEEMQSALELANERSGERFDIVHLRILPRFNVIIFLHSQDSLESDALETSTLGWPDWERTEWNGTVFSTTRAGIP